MDDMFSCYACLGSGVGCALCDGTGGGALSIELDQIDLAVMNQLPEDQNWLVDFDDLAFKVKLTRTIEGYFQTYGKALKNRRVVAVEKQLSAPVIDNDGNQLYCPVTLRRDEEEDAWVFSGPNEKPDATESLPMFLVGKADCIIYDEALKGVWIWEIKTSASPQKYLQGTALDQQVRGYCYLLQYCIQMGHFEALGVPKETPVLGFVFDVLHNSGHTSPRVLKSGKLSTQKATTCPSWLYEEFLIDHIDTQNKEDYEEYIEYLRSTVDKKLYVQEATPIGIQELIEFGQELYGRALSVAQSRVDFIRSETTEQKRASFPKNTICRGSFCWFTPVCVNDSKESRSRYTIRQPVKWLQPSNTPIKGEEKCQYPF